PSSQPAGRPCRRRTSPPPAECPRRFCARTCPSWDAPASAASDTRAPQGGDEFGARVSAASGVSPSILRKDLSQLGRSGKRGVGYSCPELVTTLRGFLGLDRDRSVAIIGAGRLGSALADYAGFRRRGLRLTAIFDIDEQKIGTTIGTLTVSALDDLPAWNEHIDLVVMA